MTQLVNVKKIDIKTFGSDFACIKIYLKVLSLERLMHVILKKIRKKMCMQDGSVAANC